jgi:hypothetical protein
MTAVLKKNSLLEDVPVLCMSICDDSSGLELDNQAQDRNHRHPGKKSTGFSRGPDI